MLSYFTFFVHEMREQIEDSVWRKRRSQSPVDRKSQPFAAFLNSARSNFFMAKKALVTRASFAGSFSSSIVSISVGATCQEKPNLSLSQPHCSASETELNAFQ